MVFEPDGEGTEAAMAQSQLIDLEMTIKQLPGVLGCVILANADGTAGEIQAFSRTGLDREAVEGLIVAEVERVGLSDHLRTIHVFELDAESLFGDRQSLERAAELAEQEARARGPLATDLEEADGDEGAPKRAGDGWSELRGLEVRPSVQRVVLSASSLVSQAEVALAAEPGSDVVGSASGEKTPHGLKVVAEATLDACAKLVPGFRVELRGASLVNVVGEEAVIVLVRAPQGDLVGSALLRSGAASEAAVRATLDAVNRFLLRGTR